jgi:hypothetical protein
MGLESKDTYTIGAEGNCSPTYYHVQDENLEQEVNANEVNLDSFKKEKQLADKIWFGDTLNSRVRLKLLDIADDFWDYTDITWAKVKGIILTGSICNYNWSKFSDIDLHLIVDFSEISDKTDFVQEYFDDKKNAWNDEHETLKIYGYPVELYVQDINAEIESGGIYNLEENKWIKKPNPDDIKSIGLDKYEIKSKAARIMTRIDDLCDAFNSTSDKWKIEKIGDKAHTLLNKIKRFRKFGLKNGGEMSIGNIVYKICRRSGYLDKLWKLKVETYDKINTIDESKIFKKKLIEKTL